MRPQLMEDIHVASVKDYFDGKDTEVAMGDTVVRIPGWKPPQLPQVRFVRTHVEAVLPKQQRVGDAGYDLHVVLDAPMVLHSFTPTVFTTGWKIAVPQGFEGQIRPRSGLAKQGITVANTPATIDENYRGDLAVILINLTDDLHTIKPGDRVAQLLIKKVDAVEIVEVDSFDDTTERGEHGFGSSGR